MKTNDMTSEKFSISGNSVTNKDKSLKILSLLKSFILSSSSFRELFEEKYSCYQACAI